MKKIILFLALVMCSMMFFYMAEQADLDKQAIKDVIRTGYIDGYFNEGNIPKMKRGFHEGFVMFSLRGNRVTQLPVEKWYDHVQAEIKKGNYPTKERVSIKFLHLDVDGYAAMAKIALTRGGKHFYTDYLSLYKFSEGWRLVSKIYQRHPY